MKKLLIILIALVAISCEKSWYNQGHIDPDSPCTFIVNDSVSVIGSDHYSISYDVFINNKEVNLLSTSHVAHKSIRSVINTMERRYKSRNNTVIVYSKKQEKECFKF